MTYKVIIVVGFLIILLLIFIISSLRTRIKVLRSFLGYAGAFYTDMYYHYNLYVNAKSQEEKTDAVLGILNLCKLQRDNHKELEKAFGVK